jgi:hypothetical protein
MTPRWLPLIAFAGTFCTSSLLAQTNPPRPFAQAGVGIYGGAHLDGPMLFVRRFPQQFGPLSLGYRFEFRDDEPYGVQVRAAGAGGEALLSVCCRKAPVELYLPAAVSMDAQFVSNPTFDPRAPDGGLFPRVAYGVGLLFGSETRDRFFAELRRSESPGGGFTAFTFGFSGAAGTRGHAPSSGVHLYTNGMHPFGSTYAASEGYRGYTIVYEREAASWADAFRGHIGIDFLDSPSYDTGAMSLLMGARFDLLRTTNGAVRASVVPQAGYLMFMEGDAEWPTVMALATAEVRVGTPALGMVASLGPFAANGIAGWFAGIQHRLGVMVALQ